MSAPAVAAKPLATLLKQLKQRPAPPPYAQPDALHVLVMAFLQWEATRRQAELALGRIHEAMVDLNELRVSQPDEVAALLGPAYPRAAERAARMLEALQEVYVREHAVTLEPLAAKNKKDQKAYLETLPGITPYVASLVLTVGLGHACVPVDGRALAVLADKGVCDAAADPMAVAHGIERAIKPADALDTHLRLQAAADERKAGSAAPAKPAKPAGKKAKIVAKSKKKK